MPTKFVKALTDFMGKQFRIYKLGRLDKLGICTVATGLIVSILGTLAEFVIRTAFRSEDVSGLGGSILSAVSILGGLLLLCGLLILILGGPRRRTTLLGWTDRTGWGKIGFGWVNKLGMGLVGIGFIAVLAGLPEPVVILALAGVATIIVGLAFNLTEANKP